MLRFRGVVGERETIVPLDREVIEVGRGDDNDLVLPDVSVSRQHAVLRRDSSGWFIHDRDSLNGVQVNDVTVRKAPLTSGDRVKIGNFEFTVEGEWEGARETVPSRGARSTLPDERPGEASVAGGISSATIVRRLSDFTADYGFEDEERPTEPRSAKRRALDQAYGTAIFAELTRLARLLIEASSVDEVLEKVLTIAFEALQVDRGFILLKDEATGELVCELSREGERMERRPRGEVPVSHTMLQEVMRERVALLTYDAQTDRRLVSGESIRIHQIRSAMCAPLWSGENIIGVMQVDSPFHVGTFTEGDLDFFTALANYAAVAVERIRYAETVEFERRVRSRLERYHSPAVIELVLSREDGDEERHRSLRPAEVTVLFADVVGFTPLAEHRDAGEVAAVLDGFFAHSVEAIFDHGGTLDKFIGDCVMAFFGAPVAQPDHALRAARAAVEIQRALASWNEKRQAAGHEPVRARIALNSGPVVVGDIGSPRRVDYTVLGNTVNVAARLEESTAGADEIVVGPSTRRLLGDRFSCESLGEVRLEGLEERVEAHRVLWRGEPG